LRKLLELSKTLDRCCMYICIKKQISSNSKMKERDKFRPRYNIISEQANTLNVL